MTMRIGNYNNAGIAAVPGYVAPDHRHAQASLYLTSGSRPIRQNGKVQSSPAHSDDSSLNAKNSGGVISGLDDQLGVIGHHDVYEILYGDGIVVGLRSEDASEGYPLGARKGDGVGLDEGWTLQLSPPLRTTYTEAIELPQSTTQSDHPGAGSSLINSLTRPESFGFRIRGMLAKLDGLIAWRRSEAGSMGRGDPREFTSLHRSDEAPHRPYGT